jgi:hypothetical protein
MEMAVAVLEIVDGGKLIILIKKEDSTILAITIKLQAMQASQ